MISAVFANSILFFYGKKRNDRESEKYDDEEIIKNDLLCRFVLDGAGRKIGESISIYDDIIVIKSKNTYLGVPLKHIDDKGKTLLVKGLIDFDKAIELGEQWRKESFSEINENDEEENEEFDEFDEL